MLIKGFVLCHFQIKLRLCFIDFIYYNRFFRTTTITIDLRTHPYGFKVTPGDVLWELQYNLKAVDHHKMPIYRKYKYRRRLLSLSIPVGLCCGEGDCDIN